VELAGLFNRESTACIKKIERAIAEKDSKCAERAAHSLKGSASNLGAHRLATLCASLENRAVGGEWLRATGQLQEIKEELERVLRSLEAEIKPA
jgi:HPt (histidine-containing phosphotransfer) domain-containing protein